MSGYNGEEISDTEWSVAEDQLMETQDAAPPLPPTLWDENRRLSLLQAAQASTIRSLMDQVTRLSGKLHERNEDYERYGKRIFALDIDVGNLKDWLAEAETERDELQTREARQPEDMRARRGSECRRGLGGKEVDRE